VFTLRETETLFYVFLFNKEKQENFLYSIKFLKRKMKKKRNKKTLNKIPRIETIKKKQTNKKEIEENLNINMMKKRKIHFYVLFLFDCILFVLINRTLKIKINLENKNQRITKENRKGDYGLHT